MSKNKLQFIFVVLLFAALSTSAACRNFLQNSAPYPTDDLLEKNFYSNREDFEKLIVLFQEDPNLSLINLKDGAWRSFDNRANLPSARLEEYKSLLSKIRVEQIERSEYVKSISLRVWWIPNNFIGSKAKYYVFQETAPQNLENSLDDIYKSGRDANEYKRIEGNWYLYLDVW